MRRSQCHSMRPFSKTAEQTNAHSQGQLPGQLHLVLTCVKTKLCAAAGPPGRPRLCAAAGPPGQRTSDRSECREEQAPGTGHNHCTARTSTLYRKPLRKRQGATNCRRHHCLRMDVLTTHTLSSEEMNNAKVDYGLNPTENDDRIQQ